MLEFERAKEIVLRQLPAPPSVIADIGGGPGRYALWLAERGHRVEHRDLMRSMSTSSAPSPTRAGSTQRWITPAT